MHRTIDTFYQILSATTDIAPDEWIIKNIPSQADLAEIIDEATDNVPDRNDRKAFKKFKAKVNTFIAAYNKRAKELNTGTFNYFN